jgi:hypothetical protein
MPGKQFLRLCQRLPSQEMLEKLYLRMGAILSTEMMIRSLEQFLGPTRIIRSVTAAKSVYCC